ncbi:glycosyltransferase [Scytonema hofmannii FACHB-248]|uniref:Glycosyltransferase n=1 Tax=Scytonema hofmannii FACHB-248 TaxID=1842502 RepID=A0ABR8GJ56_9CYAN|nr:MULTISPECIES: glycosyltransferase [Nostocales]MBD2603203.1 glycosyltransferase [Scytonema hofmannii FACHB-248]
MNFPPIADPQVTIIVAPRERFSYTRESLESIYENTEYPFKLIYVDGNSPSAVRRYLEEQAREKNFQLIRTDYYLSPNHARNLGLRQVNTKYVVFMDNDVAVTPGWLKTLVNCAEETKATVISPLICQNLPLHSEVHCAGGESGVKVETKGETTRRKIIEKIYKQGRMVEDILPQLQRQETGLAEFHCMIVRTEIFEQIGLLDEALMNTKEHVDLCMLVSKAGGSVYLEPESLVTYVPGPPLEWTDLHFYMLRWSDAWELSSLKRLRDKWNLTEDEYFQRKYNSLGRRRRDTIVAPLIKSVFGRRVYRAENLLMKLDHALNRYLTNRYARKHLHRMQNQVASQPVKSVMTASQR